MKLKLRGGSGAEVGLDKLDSMLDGDSRSGGEKRKQDRQGEGLHDTSNSNTDDNYTRDAYNDNKNKLNLTNQ